MPVNFMDMRANSVFVTKNKERCTVISSELMPISLAMPVYKVVFVTTAGAKFQALYYQNGNMFDSEHRAWDVVSVISPLQINLKRARSSSEPTIKRHREI